MTTLETIEAIADRFDCGMGSKEDIQTLLAIARTAASHAARLKLLTTELAIAEEEQRASRLSRILRDVCASAEAERQQPSLFE